MASSAPAPTSSRSSAVARHEQDRQHLAEVGSAYVRELKAAKAARAAAALPRGIFFFKGVRVDRAAAHCWRVLRAAARSNVYRLPASLIMGTWAVGALSIYCRIALGAVEAAQKAKADEAWAWALVNGAQMATALAATFVFVMFPPLHANFKEVFGPSGN